MRPREPPHRTTQRAWIGVRLGNGKRREKIGAEGVKKSGLPQAARLLSFLDSPIFARRGWLCQYFFTPSPHKQSPGRHTEGMTPAALVNCLQHFFTPSDRRFLHFFLVPFLLAVCAPAPGQDQQIFTPRRLARLRSISEAKISPDGKRVAYVLSVPRKLLKENDGPAWGELHVVDDKGNSRAFVSGSVKVSKVDWTPDGLGVSLLTKRKDDKAKSLYVIAEDGGEARKVLSHETGISGYSWSPDGKQVAFTAKQPPSPQTTKLRKNGFNQQVFEEDWLPIKVWISEVDLASPEPGGNKARPLDVAGSASEIHWSPLGGLLAVAMAPTPSVDDAFMNRKVVIIDSGSSEVRGTLTPPGKMGSFAWSPDGKHLALISSSDRSDPLPGRLVVGPVEGGELTDLLPNLAGHVSRLAWRDDRTIVYTADVGVTSRFGEVRLDGSGRKTHIPRTKGLVVRGFTQAALSGDAAFIVNAHDHPSEAYLFKYAEEGPKRLTHSNPWLQDVRLAEQEVVSFKARDGLQLEGILVRPLDYEPGKRYPLILAVHGGPEAHVPDGWVTSYRRPGQMAAARDFAVFYPNYRASTGRGVAFSKLDHGDPAGAEFDDLVDAVDHLVASGLVDRDRVGITGGSYGGYASAWGATYYSDRFAAAVMFVGISNAVSKAGTTNIPNEIYEVHHRRRVWDDWQFFLERSPIYYVKKARTPILILHGRNDPRVHPSQSLELFRLLKLQGKTPVRLVLYPGEGHGNKRAASRYDYSLRLLRWMDHYLKGPGGDPPPYDLDYGLEEKQAEKQPEEAKEGS